MSPKDNNKQVSAAVRILQQKRDASARATHLMVKNDSLITYEKAFLDQAAIKKFFIATFLERKIMSTKTSFKRIALVAASALAIAGFSAVPANAAAGNVGAFVVAKTTTATGGVPLAVGKFTASTVLDTRGISSFDVTAGDTVTLKYAIVSGSTGTNDSITVTMRGIGNIITDEAVSGVVTSNKDVEFTAGNFTVTSVPGTYTLDITMGVGKGVGGTATRTTSVTMVVAAAAGTFSSSFSTAYIASGSETPSVLTNAVAASGSSTKGTQAANIAVTLKKTNNTAPTSSSGNVLSAEVTGPGYISYGHNSGAATGCAVDPTYVAGSVGRSLIATTTSDTATILSCSDGVAGTQTITIYVTDAAGVKALLATKTVTFYGAVAKIAIGTKNFTIGKAGGGSTTSATGDGTSDTITYMPAFTVKTMSSTDLPADIASSGVPTIVSGTTTVVVSGVCAKDDDADYGSGSVGSYGCSFTTASSAKSGDTATLTVRTPDPASTTGAFLTTTIDVTVGGSVAKEVIAFDKSSYSAGEAMVVTITATDSSGNPVYDGDNSPALTGSKAVGGSLPAAGYYVGGKKATTAGALWAPAIGGDFTVIGTGTDAAATALSATASIEGDQSSSLALDAANAATDAANNAYDEAQNATQAASDALAAVTALAAQVKSLIASVKKLTAAVAKLK